jgi:hypothetical protein
MDMHPKCGTTVGATVLVASMFGLGALSEILGVPL